MFNLVYNRKNEELLELIRVEEFKCRQENLYLKQ